jgi:hypothetical protein
MSLVRTFTLFVSLALAWTAIFLLERLSLVGLYPDWLLARAPRLAFSFRWLPGDVLTVAIWIGLLAGLLFGLAIPTWIGISSRRVEISAQQARTPTAAFLLVVAVVLAIAVAIGAGPEMNGWLRMALWVGGMGLAAAGAVLANRGRTRRVAGDDGGTPERSWPWLVVILVSAAFLFAWQNSRLPATIPEASALVGLQAEELATLGREGLLTTGRAGVPYHSTLLTSAAMGLADRPLTGLAWSGLAAGLLLVFATWLFACELFRRTRLHDGEGEIIDDDGRAPALWAALAVAASLPIMNAARLPLLLEPLALGMVGLWALLRGARRGRYGWLAAGGVATGLAVVSYGSGLLFVLVGLWLWLGLLLLRRRWLLADHGGTGWRGFLLWGAALAVAASPGLCSWACGPGSSLSAWGAELGSGWATLRPGLVSALETMGLSLDSLPTLAPQMSAFGLLLAPMLLLGFFGLLFQLDQVVGWTGAGWLLLALFAAAPLQEGYARSALLLGAIPAGALAVAFGLDRSRATLTRTMGGWVNGSAMLMASGLVVAATLASWSVYPVVGGTHPDGASALARAVSSAAATNPERTLALLSAPDTPSWEHPLLQLAAREEGNLPQRLTLRLQETESWPATLPPQSRVYVLPELSGSLATLTERYPGGQFLLRRDARGNPTVYIYALP